MNIQSCEIFDPNTYSVFLRNLHTQTLQESTMQYLENIQSLLQIEEAPYRYTPEMPSSFPYEMLQNSTGVRFDEIVSPDTTKSYDINYKNKQDLNYLRQRTKSFVRAIRYADFEDGIENNVILKANEYFHKNQYATIIWLNEIYSSYQKDAQILSGILRIIAIIIPSDLSNSLIPMVKAGLADKSSQTQEAALEVIEAWRTSECLVAIETAQFTSINIKKYAAKIENELKKEL